MDLVEHFRAQAEACADMGSPMYAELLERCTRDLAEGGPVARVLAGFEQLPHGSALALRLLGSVHRLVLERRAGELGAYYPSVGGTWSLSGGWQAFVRLLEDQPELVREWLSRPPQTNEVGRATALYGGLLHLPRDLPLRLFEIGCSAGLNLRADRFHYVDDGGRHFGAGDAEVVIEDAWRGRPLEPWPGLRVVSRQGCDVDPVDPTTTSGRLLLTAYVWPDQRHRLERLRAALREAARSPAAVVAQNASAFLEGLQLDPGATTVIWHSVMWQYLSPEDRAAATRRIEELGQQATASRRLAHLQLEPDEIGPGEVRFLVQLRTWPGGEDRVIGESVGHGVPTTWR